MDDLCKGCKSHYEKNYGKYCISKPIKGDVQCPCIECILKTICENECSQFRFFHELKSITFYNCPGNY